jgi:hypothetical protein
VLRLAAAAWRTDASGSRAKPGRVCRRRGGGRPPCDPRVASPRRRHWAAAAQVGGRQANIVVVLLDRRQLASDAFGLAAATAWSRSAAPSRPSMTSGERVSSQAAAHHVPASRPAADVPKAVAPLEIPGTDRDRPGWRPTLGPPKMRSP